MSFSTQSFKRSAPLAAIASIILIVVLTVVGELWSPLKDWLKGAFTHHWIGKGVLSLVVFFLISGIGAVRKEVYSDSQIAKMLRVLSWITVAGVVILFLFFVWETVSH